jgi:hypothetical protein
MTERKAPRQVKARPDQVSVNGADAPKTAQAAADHPPTSEASGPSPGGHPPGAAVNPQDLRAEPQETPPWARDEDADYRALMASGFTAVQQKPPDVLKVISRRLHNQEYVRRIECPESAAPFWVIVDKNNKDISYIVPPDLLEILAPFAVKATLELVLTSDDALVMVTCPFSDRHGNTNEWWTSLKEIIADSTSRWLKAVANMPMRKYDAVPPLIDIPDPIWPVIEWPMAFNTAFRGRILHWGHRAMKGLVGGQRGVGRVTP